MCRISHIVSGKKTDLYRKDDHAVPCRAICCSQSTRETRNSGYKRRMNRTQQRQKAEAETAAAVADVDDETDNDPSQAMMSAIIFAARGLEVNWLLMPLRL